MKRRSNGEGTHFQRPDGRWIAQKYVTCLDGSKKRVYGTGKTLTIAKAKLEEKVKQTAHVLPDFDKNWTVGDYLDYWMKEVHAERLSETTVLSYNAMIRNHIKPTLGNRRLKSLTVHDIEAALREIGRCGATGRTQQKYRQVLSACLTHAMREQLVLLNVARLVPKPTYEAEQTVVWSLAQAQLFLQTIKKHKYYVAFLLFFIYGMRRAEVMGLRWEDIDFEEGRIHVRQQIDRVGGKMMARKLKTKNSFRELPLQEKVREELLRLAEQRGVVLPQFNPRFEVGTKGTVVVSRAGTPLESHNFYRCFIRLLREVGLPRIKIHAMRHCAATLLKSLGVPDRDIQLIMGHASILTTMNIYQHATPEIQNSGIMAAENALLG